MICLFIHNVPSIGLARHLTCLSRRSYFIPQTLIRSNHYLSHKLWYKSSNFFKTTQNVNVTLRSRSSMNKAEDSSTRLNKDVLLFTYDNPKFYRTLNIFGFIMWAFWIHTGIQFQEMRTESIQSGETQSDRIPLEKLPWYARFTVESDTTKIILSVASFCLAGCFLAGSWMYTIRSVRYLVLRKGGKQVSFVTYDPLGFRNNNIFTANIADVSCRGSRTTAEVLPMKVKGKWMNYLLFKNGEYRNGALFDRTVGYYRG